MLVLLTTIAAPGHAEVSVYGTINVSFQSIEARPGIKKTSSLTDSNSFWGIQGSEDLGGGLGAYFVLQQLFDASGGSGPFPVNSNGFSDQAFVGLKGNFGAVQIGYMPVHNTAGLLRWDGAAAYMGMATLLLPMVHGNGQTLGSAAGGRSRNMLQYISPNMGGLQASFFIGRPDDDTRLADGKQAKAYGLTATYSHGPWFALYSHINEDNTNVLKAASGYSVIGDRFAGVFNQAEGFNVALVLDRQRNDDPLITRGMRRTTVGVPAWYRSGPHTFAVTYARASHISKLPNSGATFAMAGYSYGFSKRTNIYIDGARISNEMNAHYDFQQQAEVGGVGGPPNFPLLVPAGSNPTTVQIGIRHSF